MTATAQSQVIDLLSAADDLQPSFPAVAHKIRGLSNCHSIKSDLDMALDMVKSCPEASRAADQGLGWAQHASMAMMHSAIVFYARGVNTSSKHRITLDLRSKLTEQQRRFHDLLCQLRDDAVAHFGPGELPTGFTFHDEKLMLPIDRPEGSSVLMVSRRAAFAPEFTAQFRDHLCRVLLLLQREIAKREEQVLQEISQHDQKPGLEAVLRAHVKTAGEAMGRADAPDVFLAGSREGSRTVYQSDAGWVEMPRN